jgi:hypothetical protein
MEKVNLYRLGVSHQKEAIAVATVTAALMSGDGKDAFDNMAPVKKNIQNYMDIAEQILSESIQRTVKKYEYPA